MSNQGPARRRTRSADVGTALADAAEAVLVRLGPAAVTVRAVATEAGVAPMGVYNRFGGKDGLAAELLVRGFLGLSEAIADHGEPDPLQRLRGAGLRYRTFALAHPQHYAVMFDDAMGCGLDASPAVTEAGGRAFGALVGHVAHVMATGLAPEGDATDVAQQIWSTTHGAVSLELKGMVRTPDPEATYTRLVDLLIRGLVSPTSPQAPQAPQAP